MLPSALIRAVIFVYAAALVQATCAPFVPQSESQVLERLPFAANDPVMEALWREALWLVVDDIATNWTGLSPREVTTRV